MAVPRAVARTCCFDASAYFVPTMPAQPIRVIQSILVALMAGLVLFGGVTGFLRWTSGPVGSGAPVEVLLIVVAAVYVGCAVASVVVRSKLAARARANRTENVELLRKDLLPNELRAAAIVGAAFAEGPGLLAAVVVLIGGPVYLLALVLVSVLWIAKQIPTRTSAEDLLAGAS